MLLDVLRSCPADAVGCSDTAVELVPSWLVVVAVVLFAVAVFAVVARMRR